MTETPWVAVREVCHMYGVTYETAKNKMLLGNFPVPTYKVGKTHVIDRTVHDQYFARHREAGLAAMKTTRG